LIKLFFFEMYWFYCFVGGYLSNSKAPSSILLNLKDNKILEILPMEKGKNAFVIKGKHAGYSGKINEIVSRGGKEIAKISSEEGKVNVWTKNIIIIK